MPKIPKNLADVFSTDGPAAPKLLPISPQIGDIVLYNEMRGPVPATVQGIYPNGSLRLWVYGNTSIFHKDGVVEGKEIGYWTRRSV